MKNSLRRAPLLLTALFLQGCALFSLSPYDAQAYQYLARMEAFQFRLIDTFTVSAGNKPQPTADDVRAECREGDLTFQEARNYVEGRPSKDVTRQTAFKILTQAYAGDCQDLLERAANKEPFYTPTAAKELKKIHKENYDEAMRGEWARVRKN